MRSVLGKGAEHALYIYQEWFRQGSVQGTHPAFNNAAELFRNICSNTLWEELKTVDSRSDGSTEKLLFKIEDTGEVESVVIPMEAGGTLCISSQVGCRMGCRFCETGKLGLLNNLTTEQIVGQVFHARHRLKASIRNVVFMGMGEPFDNYEAVLQASKVISDPHGLNIGPRHQTISTSGRVEEIRRFASEQGPMPNLAVSINAPHDTLRTQLMPINRTHNLQSLYDAMRFYNDKTGRQILIAYILLDRINDKLEQADQLATYLGGLDVKINLIPYNAQSSTRYSCSPEEKISAFKQQLIERGYQVLLRATKGDQIMAACGQLGNLKLKSSIK